MGLTCAQDAARPFGPSAIHVARPPVTHCSFERRRVGRCAVLVCEPELECHSVSPFRRSGWNRTARAKLSRGPALYGPELVAPRWVPDAERRYPSTMDLRRQTRIGVIVRQVVAAQKPRPQAGEATRRIQHIELPRRITQAKTSSGYPVAADHRCVAEVAVLSQARVSPSQVVEADSETDRSPPRDAIEVSAPTQACWLAERTNGAVGRAVPPDQEAADLNVTTHNDRCRLRRRCRNRR